MASNQSDRQSDPARFFVALLPPQNLQAQITAIKQEMWHNYQSRAALKSPPHITLQPPFLWPDGDVGQLVAGLTEFARHHAAVPVRLSGFGAFPPRVIYVDVICQGPLMTIQPELRAYLATTFGIGDRKAQNRPFAPHVTIAFRDLKPGLFRRAWPDFEQRCFEAQFIAEDLTLLKHDGQKWQIFSEFTFGAEGEH